MLESVSQFLNYLSFAILLIVIVCQISPRCVYYLKLTILVLGYINMGIMMTFYGLFHNTHETSRFTKLLLDPIGKLMGIKFNVKGEEFIDKKRCYIVVANHQHSLDVVAAMQIWNLFGKSAVIAKHELKWLGPFGLALQLSGTIFVKRAQHDKALAALNLAVQKAKDTNTSIHIFPEGTRRSADSEDKYMLPFKKGAFHMAVDAGLPILPVIMSEYDFIDSKRKRFGYNIDPEVTVTVLKAVETTGLTKADIDQLTEDTRNKMIDVFKRDKEERNLRRRNVQNKKTD